MSEIRYKAAAGQVGRVIAARLFPGTDLIEGIEKICKDHGIKYAAVVCSIGSLQKATFMYLVPKPEAKMKAGYTAPYELPGPIEFLGGQGIVCEGENGEMITHFHCTISDQLDHVYGGHVVKGKNPILMTMDLVIIEIKGAKLLRKYDAETEVVQFSPEPE